MALENNLPKVAAAPRALTALTALVTARRAEERARKMLKIPWTPGKMDGNISENIELASWKHLEALFYLGECYT